MRILTAVLTTTLAAALLAGPGAAAPAHSTPAPGEQVGSFSLASRASTQVRLEAGVVSEVNRVRRNAKCGSLTVVSGLRIAARRHSNLMAHRRQLSHRLSGEASLQRRTAAAGYTRPTMLGEVIAAGPRSPYDVVRAWLRSSSHRALLLNCRFRHIGAGVAASGDGRRWWTVDLGRR